MMIMHICIAAEDRSILIKPFQAKGVSFQITCANTSNPCLISYYYVSFNRIIRFVTLVPRLSLCQGAAVMVVQLSRVSVTA